MRQLLLTIILVFFLGSAEAQVFTLQKDSVTLDNFIMQLEVESGYDIFYASPWMGAWLYDVNFQDAPVLEAIKWLCNRQGLTYAVVDDTKVIFFKDYNLKTNFAEIYSSYIRRKEVFTVDSSFYKPPQTIHKQSNHINPEYQLYTIGNPAQGSSLKRVTLSGKIKDIETGEPLIGAVVYVDDLKDGTITNPYGFYSYALPKGRYKVEFRSVGMKTTYRNVIVHSDGELDVDMKTTPQALNEVIITAKSEDAVKNLRMGMEKISMKTLKQLPLGMGEADVIKSTLLLPGVQSVGEASGGFNVRGGSTDQNLILLSEAPILNTSHFFGFFSGFNSDIIKDITLYKSGIPAKYGGRVSSVMDITLKEGNRKNVKVNGGISPVSGRLIVEGPIQKEKSSFVLGARTTYSDWVLKLLDDPKLKNSKANFHDLQGNLSYDYDKSNSFYLSGYYSYDKFDYYSEDAFRYNTLASTLKWKHIFSPKLFSTFSGVMSNYNYQMQSRTDSTSLSSVEYKLNQYTLKSDFSYHSNQNHKIDFGLSATWYNLSPGERKPISELSTVTYKELEHEQGLETALYLSDEFELTHFLSLSAGLRYSFYSNFGPKTEFNYQSDAPRNGSSIIDTTYYSKGTSISFYSGPEIRLSSNIRLSSTSSMKLGYNRMYQYIQMISNTAAMSPTDIWKLSDNFLKPQRGDQYSIGFYKKMRQNRLEASVEAYYKKLKNVVDYKGGADLVMNEHLETEVLNGDGNAYGIEFMIQKKQGKLTGWVNYTYSRVFHRIQGEFAEEQVNNGDYYPANYDKPNDFKFVVNYKLGRRLNVTSNFFYSTGRPFTAPVAYYQFGGANRVYYSERNSMRMPDYIRMDLAATINGNLRAKKLNHSSWTFAVYNVFGRRNAYNIFYRTEGEEVKGYKMSIFAQPIFTVTYNFKIFGNASDDF